MSKIFLDKDNNVFYEGYETHEIVANPTLAGTEDNLTGLKIGNTKYKINGNGSLTHLYQHNITIYVVTESEGEEYSFFFNTTALTTSNTQFTLNTLVEYLHDNGFEYNNGKPNCITASGAVSGFVVIGIYNDDENDLTKLGVAYDDSSCVVKTDYITQQNLDDYNGIFEDTIIQIF